MKFSNSLYNGNNFLNIFKDRAAISEDLCSSGGMHRPLLKTVYELDQVSEQLKSRGEGNIIYL